MFSEKETRANFRTAKGPPRVKKSPLPALESGSLLLAGAIKSLSSTDGVENPERCGARDARDLSGLPRAGGAQGTQGLLGQRPAEDDAHGQAQLSTAGHSPQPPAGTDPTFPTPSLCPRPGRGGSAPKACRRPPTRAIPTQSTPRLRLETAPRGTIPKCMRPGGRRRHPSRHREQSSQPAGHRLAAGEGDRSQPRTAPSRAARSGDADTKGTRASPTWSRAVRAPARPRCARLRWPRPVPARGCRCPRQPPARSPPAPQRSALSASPPCAPRTARSGSAGRERALSAGAGDRANSHAGALCRPEVPRRPRTRIGRAAP